MSLLVPNYAISLSFYRNLASAEVLTVDDVRNLRDLWRMQPEDKWKLYRRWIWVRIQMRSSRVFNNMRTITLITEEQVKATRKKSNLVGTENIRNLFLIQDNRQTQQFISGENKDRHRYSRWPHICRMSYYDGY